LAVGLAATLLSISALAQSGVAPASGTAGAVSNMVDAVSALKWDLGLRIQWDHSSFDGVYAVDGGRHGASYLRRATLGGEVSWHRKWSFSADLEYHPDSQFGLDVYALSWQPSRAFELRLGRINPDFGLEHSGSSNWTYGVERSAIWDLAPDVADSGGGKGLRADGHGERWQVSLGVYDKGGYNAWTARAVSTPLVGDGSRLHFGASLSVSQGAAEDGRIRSRLGVRGVTEVDAGRRSTLGGSADLPAFYDGDTAFGLEAAWQVGRLMLQAEGLQRRLTGAGGQSDRLARGAYVLAAWTMAGEPRGYDPSRGRFGRPESDKGSWGAWEVFYRLDSLDVDDGRAATVQSAGIGWTANRNWRALLNLHSARSDDANRGGDTTGQGLSVRLQAVF
jgi:phosphate-selective porin OprO/OprP